MSASEISESSAVTHVRAVVIDEGARSVYLWKNHGNFVGLAVRSDRRPRKSTNRPKRIQAPSAGRVQPISVAGEERAALTSELTPAISTRLGRSSRPLRRLPWHRGRRHLGRTGRSIRRLGVRLRQGEGAYIRAAPPPGGAPAAAPGDDPGGGRGAGHQSFPLARLGYRVTLLDPGPAMLEKPRVRLSRLPDEDRNRVGFSSGCRRGPAPC